MCHCILLALIYGCFILATVLDINIIYMWIHKITGYYHTKPPIYNTNRMYYTAMALNTVSLQVYYTVFPGKKSVSFLCCYSSLCVILATSIYLLLLLLLLTGLWFIYLYSTLFTFYCLLHLYKHFITYLYIESYLCFCHLLICHNISLSSFLLIWLDLFIRTGTFVLLLLFIVLGCIPCRLAALHLLALGWQVTFSLPFHHLVCLCMQGIMFLFFSYFFSKFLFSPIFQQNSYFFLFFSQLAFDWKATKCWYKHTHKSSPLHPTGSTVAVQREDGNTLTHGVVVGHGSADNHKRSHKIRVMRTRHIITRIQHVKHTPIWAEDYLYDEFKKFFFAI